MKDRHGESTCLEDSMGELAIDQGRDRADENYIALFRLFAKATFCVLNKTTWGYHSFHEICTYLPRYWIPTVVATKRASHSQAAYPMITSQAS